MTNKTKIPLAVALLSILAYSNQGISSLPDQCIYYLTREGWGLNAATIGLISWITGLAWYIKVLWGYFIDCKPIKGYRAKYYLRINYFLMLATYLYIMLFGLNFYSLIITGFLINVFIGFSDVAVDSQMVIAEQKHKLKGRLQAIQWTALGVGGLIVALGGAAIAKYFPEHLNYKIAYGFAGLVPIAMLYYLFRHYKEKAVSKTCKTFKLKDKLKNLKDKRLLIGLVFIACLNFCPSFGTALMIKVRETLHVDKMFLGYLGAMGIVLGIVGYFLYYKFAYKYPMKKLLYFMVLFSALTNLFYLHIPNQWYLVFYNLAFGAFGGITFMTLLSFFVKIIPKGSEGIFYAIVTSVNNFAARGGNFFGGALYDKYGYNINVILSTIMTLLCIAFIPYLKIGDEE